MAFVLSTKKQASQLERYLQTLGDDLGGATASHPLSLDIGKLGAASPAGRAILSTALLGTFEDRPIELTVPRRSDWLDRSGLSFALANRSPDRTTVHGLDVARWRPEGEQRPLFDLAGSEEPAISPNVQGQSFAAFLDPHRLDFDARNQHAVNSQIWPWLERLLPRPRNKARAIERHRFNADVGKLVNETVANIKQHADDWGWDSEDGFPNVHSFIEVAVTQGGGSSRVYVSVQDTGAGIARTARAHIPSQSIAKRDDAHLVRDLFAGKIPPWGRARGLGLPKVYDIARRNHGDLHVASGTTRVSMDRKQRLGFATMFFDLRGTVITLGLRVP